MEGNLTVSAYAAPITSEENTALSKFITLLQSKKIVYDEKKFDNGYLVRFLRARKLDINKTFEMFTNFLKWRVDNKIDEIKNFDLPELKEIKLFYPHGLHKVDKQGRPIYIEVLGELKVDEMFKITSPERLLMYQAREYEKAIDKIFPACSKNVGKYIQQTFAIVDLKKMTSSLLSKKFYGFLKLTSHNSQNYYPEMLGQMIVVNAGLLFKAAWSVCKAFVDEKTRKKVTTVGSDYKKKLLEHVDPANLPAFLGGECTCQPYGCLFSSAGPWGEDEKIEITPEDFKVQQKLIASSEDPTEDTENVNLENLDLDDEDQDPEDKERLAELSKQLNEGMNLSKGQKENTKFKMESNVELEGETPINTQEVKLD